MKQPTYTVAVYTGNDQREQPMLYHGITDVHTMTGHLFLHKTILTGGGTSGAIGYVVTPPVCVEHWTRYEVSPSNGKSDA